MASAMMPNKVRKIEQGSYSLSHQQPQIPDDDTPTVTREIQRNSMAISSPSVIALSDENYTEIIQDGTADLDIIGEHDLEGQRLTAVEDVISIENIIDVLSDDEAGPMSDTVASAMDHENILVVDDEEDDECGDNTDLRALRLREDPGLILEPDYSDVPREHNLDMDWPMALLIHTYIIPSEEYDICLRNATLDPSTRLRLATAIDETTELWVSGIVCSDESQFRVREAGRFPLVASAVMECLNASGIKFTTRYNLGTAPGQQEHSGIFINLPSDVVPVTVKVYSDVGGELINQILVNRVWCSYARRKFLDEELTSSHVNPECLTRDMISINLYAKDCIISSLVSRGFGIRRFPNMECAFQKDRRFYENAWPADSFERTPGKFGWSALPHGLLTFLSYSTQMLPLYPYDINTAGSGNLWIQPLSAKEPNCGSSEQAAVAAEDSDDDLIFELVRSASRPSPPTPSQIPTENVIDSLADLLNCKNYDSMPEYTEKIEGLTTELLPHQKRGVHWMLNMERQIETRPKDVLEKQGTWYGWTYDYEYEMSKHPSYDEIMPAASLQQPRGGILADEMGLGKTVQMLALILADDSLATTDDQENEKPSNEEPSNESFRNWIGAFGCGEVEKTETQWLSGKSSTADGGTLVVCPLSVLTSWKSIIKDITSIPDSKIAIYHGNAKITETIEGLKSRLIVLTTYNIVGSKESTLLHKITWRRVVLDEAHQIRNTSALTTLGCLGLVGRRKWCLTGTPIQNKLLDLQPLLEFLQWIPFTDRKKGKAMLSRWQSSENNVKLKLAIQPICLRRTKLVLAAGSDSSTQPLNLPDKSIEILKIPMTETEMKRYKALNEMSKQAVMNMGSNETAKLWTVLTHLRLMASTEEILSPNVRKTLDNFLSYRADQRSALIDKLLDDENLKEIINGKSDICPICLEPDPDIITKCKHAFHSKCFQYWLGNTTNTCPICRTTLDKKCLVNTSDVKARAKQIKSVPMEDYVGSEIRTSAPESSKVQHLCDKIAMFLTEDPTTKIVAFSSFVKLLRHVKDALARRGIKTEIFSGDLTSNKRTKIIDEFQNGTSPYRVLLASIKAAGVGITLTAANICFVIDPWWNPHVEDQAIDRIHRIGQTRPVQIYRVVSSGTIEEIVVARQEIKRAVANAALNTNAGGSLPTTNEIRRLFLTSS